MTHTIYMFLFNQYPTSHSVDHHRMKYKGTYCAYRNTYCTSSVIINGLRPYETAILAGNRAIGEYFYR